MQKPNTKNKTSNSKITKNINDSHVSPARKKLSQQSIRQFKIQIDHQIAKCLDTLDRQGLKFLKQTLKTSNLFNSTNFQIQDQNAKYELENSRTKIDPYENFKIQPQKMQKYFESESQQQKNQRYLSKNNESPKKKSKKQINLQNVNKNSIKKVESNQAQSKYQKQTKKKKSSLKVNKQSTASIISKQKVQQKPQNQINKSNRSGSSSRFNKTKQSYASEQVSKKADKKVQYTQNRSVAQIKLKQAAAQQNINSKVTKKTVIQNKKTNEKISLGQILSKKMQQLHISKVGPSKNDSHQNNRKERMDQNISNMKSSFDQPEQAIQQEIIEGIEHQLPSQDIKHQQSEVTQSIIQQSLRQPLYKQPQIKISQKSNPLKPFAKDKLNQVQNLQKQSSYTTQKNNYAQKKQLTKQINHQQKAIQQPGNTEQQIQKLSTSIQVDNMDLDRNSYYSSVDKQKMVQMSIIVDKINKLSPQKLAQIQKYIDYIQHTPIEKFNQQNNFQNKSQQYLVKQQNNQNKLKNNRPSTKIEKNQYLTDKDSINCQSSSKPPLIILKYDSKKSNKQKKQKASMIFSNSKSASRSRIKIDVDFQQDKQKPTQSNFKVIQNNPSQKNLSQKSYLKTNLSQNSPSKISQKVILNKQEPIKMEKIDFNQNISKQKGILIKAQEQPQKINLSKLQKINLNKEQQKIKQQAYKQIPSKQLKEQSPLLNISHKNELQLSSPNIMQNNSLNIECTDVKMLNINNRKSQTNKVVQNRTNLKFRILSNRGHSSLFGLTGIELFTIDNKRVTIKQKQLGQNQSSTVKLLSLFNGDHHFTRDDNVYQSSMNKNQIIVQLDKDNDKIGGILVYNFNRSSLQSQKQVDQMQIYHNDIKMWKGVINKGSYNQDVDYSTKIQFIPNFKFPQRQIPSNIFNPYLKQDKLKTLNEKDFKTLSKNQQNKNNKEPFLIKQNEKEKLQTITSINKQKHNQGLIYQSQKPTSFNNQLGYKKINQLSYEINQLGYEHLPNKIINKSIQPKIQKSLNQNQISTKSFKINDSIENIQNWNTKNQSNLKRQSSKLSIKNNYKTQRQTNYDQFDTMLKGLQTNIHKQKSKSKITPSSIDIQNNNNQQLNKNLSRQNLSKNTFLQQKIQTKTTNQQIEDFINASIFKEKSQFPVIYSEKRKISPPQKQMFQKKKPVQSLQRKNKDINIDDFLGQLEDVMKSKGNVNKKSKLVESSFQIPNLPQGSKVQIEILQNWGHQAYVGLQGIQFFNSSGDIISPIQIQCDKNPQNINLVLTLNNKNIISRDEKIQTKIGFDKNTSTNLCFTFSSNQTFSLIRIWNYNGHRVHSNIGIKNCFIRINNKQVFIGDLKRNQSTPDNFHKNFQAILFTNDSKIIKQIKQKDWLTQYKNKNKQQKQLFKSTLINFNRPKTKNSQQTATKENLQIPYSTNNKQIKLSKRQCWEYEPPELPEGNILIFNLHDTWGDQNFIGLNGIQIFDSQGKMLTKDKISKIKAFPSSTGQKNDKRVVENLINGNNLSNMDTHIWLSTFQSDLEKIETGKPNTIIIELAKPIKISGINIYNYSKTPERGVRQIEIEVNNIIAFRGYLKIFNKNDSEYTFHTTINFTKNIQLLSKINYESYNQDTIDQNVLFINQKKTVKA